ncbi:Mur ligase family protein [Desulfosporosinus sp. FKB]|uniref:cyanophycin synthetase family protein n=1 Tax=Desulfosporosinus sp. FKB TaxID=1969835 RepID=UPI000B4A3AEE|nr:Mur ligase family protein [Desulfosporosinus sp. FKB]
MKIIGSQVFQGKNIYSHKKCIRLDLDLEGYSEIPTKDIKDFNKTLKHILPELSKHRCGIDEDQGFYKRLEEGTYLAHVSEHIIIALHNMLGLDVNYGKARELSGDNYYVIYQYEYAKTGLEAGRLAIDLINSLIAGQSLNIDLRFNLLKQLLRAEQLGVSTLAICEEAKKRGIPILRLSEDHIVQLGYGKYAKRIRETLNYATQEIAATYRGTKRNVAAHMADQLFNDGQTSIPLVAITGTNGKTTTTRLIAHILSIAGYTVGMTTSDGIYINNRCISKGDTTGPLSALAILKNKDIEAAVLETARGGIIREGLAYDLADVGVITNITEDHLGIDEVHTLDDLAKVKALVGEAVKEDGFTVINGDDKMSLTIMTRFKSQLIIFSLHKDNKALQANLKNGGYGIYRDQDKLVVQKGSSSDVLMDIKDIGISMNGILIYNVQNAMASCAAAIGLGIDLTTIKLGLSSFNHEQNPGRFNMYSVNNKRVILDYGHNKDGYSSVLEGLKHMEYKHLFGVIGVPGDRIDKDIIDVGKCAGENFDYIIIKEDIEKRGRIRGEVADLLERGVLAAKFPKQNVLKILEETEAFKAALEQAEPEDIVIIFFEKSEPLIDIIESMPAKIEALSAK